MFRRDKESKLDNEGLRRMREAIRQRLEQDEQTLPPTAMTEPRAYDAENVYAEPAAESPPAEDEYTYAEPEPEPEPRGYSREDSFLEPEPAAPAPAEEPRRASRVPEAPRTTTVAADATWRGALRSTADIYIDGALDGEIETTQGIYVADGARVEANVRAGSIVVAGMLSGQINCLERLEVLPSGRVSGQLDVGAIVVHEGAFLGGRLRMTGQRGAAPGDGEPARPMLQRVR